MGDGVRLLLSTLLNAGGDLRRGPSDCAGGGGARCRTVTLNNHGSIRVDGSAAIINLHAVDLVVERVVANLVGNAVRVSKGKPVRVLGHVLPSTVEVLVVDQGPGVPLERRDRMFEPFQRLGRVARLQPSSGKAGHLAVSWVSSRRTVSRVTAIDRVRRLGGGGPFRPMPAHRSPRA